MAPGWSGRTTNPASPFPPTQMPPGSTHTVPAGRRSTPRPSRSALPCLDDPRVGRPAGGNHRDSADRQIADVKLLRVTIQLRSAARRQRTGIG